MDELKRFENDLKGSDELSRAFEAAFKRIAEEGQPKSDGEVLVAVARELGYDVSIAALEQAQAEAQELDLDALSEVSGGEDDEEGFFDGFCTVNDMCVYLYNSTDDDRDGHSWWCMRAWHCLAMLLHTEGHTKDETCWSNYSCLAFNN